MLTNASLATIQDTLLNVQVGLILIFVGWQFSDRLPTSWGCCSGCEIVTQYAADKFLKITTTRRP